MRFYVSVILNTKDGENRKNISYYSGQTIDESTSQPIGDTKAKEIAVAKYHNEMYTAMHEPTVTGAMIKVYTSDGVSIIDDKYGKLLEEEHIEPEEVVENEETEESEE